MIFIYPKVLLSIENIKRVSYNCILTQTFNNSLSSVHEKCIYLLVTAFCIHRTVHLPVFLLWRGRTPPEPPVLVSVLLQAQGSCLVLF